jgi:hypothetical protein
MRLRSTSQSVIAALVLVLIICFQNCSQIKQSGSGSNQSKSELNNNNGEPYLGKPYENGRDCVGADPVRSRILYVSPSKAYLAKDSCQLIEPARELPAGSFQLDSADPTRLQYNGLTYVATSKASFVQKAEAIQAAAATITADFANSSTAGDLIVCFVDYKNAGGAVVTSVTDSSGNAFVRALGPTPNVGQSAGRQSEAWYAENTAGSAGLSLTAALSSATDAILVCEEFAGVAASQSLDGVVASTNLTPPGGTALVGPVATTASDDLLVSAVWHTQTAPTPGPGFTLISNFSDDIYMYGLGSAPGNYIASANGVGDWAGFLLAFKTK